MDRAILLNVCREVMGSDTDLVRMVTALLMDTALQVRVGTAKAEHFKTTTGTPQGDALSPVLFNMYYEAALRELRTTGPDTPTEGGALGLPSEMQNADGLDFVSMQAEHLERKHETALNTLPGWSLEANADKTERVAVQMADSTEDRGNEAWRSSKTLGPLLGDAEDVGRRIQLDAASMKGLRSFWGSTKVSLELKARLYGTYVKPVLLYNAGTWGPSARVIERLNVAHRRHLRSLAGIRYPHKISNENPYKKCGGRPVFIDVEQQRWNLLGHILRMDPTTPAQRALDVAVGNNFKGRAGAHRATPLRSIISDVKQNLNRTLTTTKDPEDLRRMANDRDTWTKSMRIRRP